MLFDHVRFAGRILAKNRGFTAAAVICLALGIGATTAIFSVVHAVLLKPLPYRDSGRLVRLYTEFPNFPRGGLMRFAMSPPELFDLRRETKSWDGLEAWQIGQATLAGQNEPVRATVAYATGGMIAMLGVPPALGRTFTDQEDKPGAPLTAILSHALWRRAYGSDAGILGRDIQQDGKLCTVIGVMPEGFDFPAGDVEPADAWIPLHLNPGDTARGSHRLQVLGRLRNGVSLQQARDEMTRVIQTSSANTAPRTHGFHPVNHTILLAGYQDEVVRTVRLAMLVLLGAVGFVLLISSVNVANLLLARAETRRREIAIRRAIGATLGSMTAQLVVEGLLLSALGAMLGVALAYAGMRLIVLFNAGSIPRANEIALDGPVLLFTLAIAILTGVGFGMAPAMHLFGQNLHETLKAAAGRVTSSTAANRFRMALVTAEIALALMLLIGAGLMVKAFWRLQSVATGIDTSGVATMRVTLPQAAYAKTERRVAFWNEVQNRASAMPGVRSAAAAVFVPPVEMLLANDTLIEGFVPRPGGPTESVDHYNSVGPKYFETLGIRLLEGRYFDSRDGIASPEVVIVNEMMARTFWGSQSAVGRRVKPSRQGNWRTVIAVVADVKNRGLDQPGGTELYFPEDQGSAFRGDTTMTVLARGAPGSDAMRLMPAVRSMIRSIDPGVAVSRMMPMEEVVGAARSRPRFLAALLTIFAAVSLILAALGIYGVMSYSVAQRTPEIGIRMAMGARSEDVLGLVLRDAMTIAIAGAAAGAAGAFALTRVLRGLLFSVPAFDIGTFSIMAIVLVAVTFIACYVPARRAAKTDPLIALRYE